MENNTSANEQWDAGIRGTLIRILPHAAAIQKVMFGDKCSAGDIDEEEVNDIINAVHLVLMRHNKLLSAGDYSRGIEALADGTYDQSESFSMEMGTDETIEL